MNTHLKQDESSIVDPPGRRIGRLLRLHRGLGLALLRLGRQRERRRRVQFTRRPREPRRQLTETRAGPLRCILHLLLLLLLLLHALEADRQAPLEQEDRPRRDLRRPGQRPSARAADHAHLEPKGRQKVRRMSLTWTLLFARPMKIVTAPSRYYARAPSITIKRSAPLRPIRFRTTRRVHTTSDSHVFKVRLECH